MAVVAHEAVERRAVRRPLERLPGARVDHRRAVPAERDRHDLVDAAVVLVGELQRVVQAPVRDPVVAERGVRRARRDRDAGRLAAGGEVRGDLAQQVALGRELVERARSAVGEDERVPERVVDDAFGIDDPEPGEAVRDHHVVAGGRRAVKLAVRARRDAADLQGGTVRGVEVAVHVVVGHVLHFLAAGGGEAVELEDEVVRCGEAPIRPELDLEDLRHVVVRDPEPAAGRVDRDAGGLVAPGQRGGRAVDDTRPRVEPEVRTRVERHLVHFGVAGEELPGLRQVRDAGGIGGRRAPERRVDGLDDRARVVRHLRRGGARHAQQQRESDERRPLPKTPLHLGSSFRDRPAPKLLSRLCPTLAVRFNVAEDFPRARATAGGCGSAARALRLPVYARRSIGRCPCRRRTSSSWTAPRPAWSASRRTGPSG